MNAKSSTRKLIFALGVNQRSPVVMLPCPFNTMHPAAAAAFGLQTTKPPNSSFFNLDRLQFTTVNAASPNFSLANFSPYTIPAAYPPWDHMAAVTVKALGFGMFDPRQARLIQEEPKPQHSYIGLIAMAILSSAERKMAGGTVFDIIYP
ncbi:Forkhead box protein [Trichinella spiralis]|uniref:Forkhead box protein n=1 Tax=Trichinella spiralis TaxID=6334 RepID=A0ABR3KNW0_TRISP